MSSSSLGTLRSPCGPRPRRRRPRRRRRFRPRPRFPPPWPLFWSRSPDWPPELPPALEESEEDASEVCASAFGAGVCSASGDSGTFFTQVDGRCRGATMAHLQPSGGESRNRLTPFLGSVLSAGRRATPAATQRCVSRDTTNVGRNHWRIKVPVAQASCEALTAPRSLRPPCTRSSAPDSEGAGPHADGHWECPRCSPGSSTSRAVSTRSSGLSPGRDRPTLHNESRPPIVCHCTPRLCVRLQRPA